MEISLVISRLKGRKALAAYHHKFSMAGTATGEKSSDYLDKRTKRSQCDCKMYRTRHDCMCDNLVSVSSGETSRVSADSARRGRQITRRTTLFNCTLVSYDFHAFACDVGLVKESKNFIHLNTELTNKIDTLAEISMEGCRKARAIAAGRP